MSEEIDLNTNNLCTTEDAFEEFQATSMYEEDEYITLSDIVPPEQRPPDLTIDLNDIPYEDEVVLETQLEEQVPEVNSTIEIVSEDVVRAAASPIPDEFVSEDQSIIGEDNSIAEDNSIIVQKPEPKRGRRKKIQQSESILTENQTYNEQSDSNQDVLAQAPPVKRKGRKPQRKRYSYAARKTNGQTSIDNNEKVNNNTEALPEPSLDHITQLNSSSENENTSTGRSIRRRPGRPRGKQVINVIPQEAEMTKTELGDTESKINEHLPDNTLNAIPKRGRRKRKDLSETYETSELEQTTIENKLEQSQFEEVENTSLASQVNTKNKRGRRKRQDLSETTTYETPEVEEPIVENKLEHSQFDEVENTSLVNQPTKKNKSPVLPKRRRRKQQDLSEATTYETSELEETIFDSQIEQSQTEEVENTDMVTTKTNKSPKKRKRSKKNHTDAILEDVDKIDAGKALTDEDEFGDDICLSKLKETLEPTEISDINSDIAKVEDMEVEVEGIVTTPLLLSSAPPIEENAELPTTSNLKSNEIQDDKETFTNIIDLKNENELKQDFDTNTGSKGDLNDSLLIEDTSKRPTRVKARRTFQYDDGSDEDPFANVESSDDEPKKSKKGRKYYSDDEYVPGASKGGNVSSSDISDSDIDAEVDELMKSQRRKKQRLDSDKSPRKRGRKSKWEKDTNAKSSVEIETIVPNAQCTQDDDIEVCLQSSVIKTDDESKQKLGWGASNEFESFIAKKIQGTEIKIKKACSVQPLEIPVINPNDAKKTVETGMQTTQTTTSSVEVQTSAPYDVPMKDNVPLTSQQAENACEFLKSIVKTTAELGELMTQKSEDFIKKKINTDHVTDTFKLDYCVRKSFLLFKLAKHNLMQMEEDLSKQYDDFLNKNDLMKHKEKPKVLTAVKKTDDGDSDCEIIDAPPTIIQKPKTDVKPKFNPKTVFLNKELSIKIAKKPSEEKKLQIKGRHSVWISDSVMVKKVKPTQSFLAQDSRNKKPPDQITIEMVNNFFKEYNRQQALLTCAPFVTNEWMTCNRKYVCSYFFTKAEEFSTTSVPEIPSGSEMTTSAETIVTNLKNVTTPHSEMEHKKYNPKPLFSICTRILQEYLNLSCSKPHNSIVSLNGVCTSIMPDPEPLSPICINNKHLYEINYENHKTVESNHRINALPLQSLCLQKLTESMGHLYDEPQVEINTMTQHSIDIELVNSFPFQDVKSLFSLCVISIQDLLYTKKIVKKPLHGKIISQKLNTPNSLKTITYRVVTKLMNFDNIKTPKTGITKKVKSLSDLCFEKVTQCYENIQENTPKECLTINSIDRLTEEAFLNMTVTTNLTEDLEYYADDDTNFYDDENEENDFDGIDNTEDSNWISQVEMKEFISIPNKTIENVRPTEDGNILPMAEEETPVTRVKLEPEEETDQIVDSSLIKTEPMHALDEMTIIPESIMTNSVSPGHIFPGNEVQRKGSASYDVDSFEAFVRTNKMMHALNEQDPEEIFSQSASRIRRQHEPDSDPENDMGMSLLVPQTFEPLFIENAKDRLMESSGDESSSTKKEKVGKKKIDRRKTKAKKVEPTKPDKQLTTEKTLSKEISKEKQPITNEVAILTRRMREKIRQEEKKIASSDSESENMPIISRKDKEIDNILSKKTKETLKENMKAKQKLNKAVEDEIQCNNVDSTEQLNEKVKCSSPDPSTLTFSGFSAVDQNEVSNYQKYVKYVYDKILPKEEPPKPKADEPLFSPEEPVELLECEPTMPMFDNEDTIKAPKANLKKKESKEIAIKESTLIDEKDCQLPYKLRHGWKCYQLDANDPKLYQAAQIVLEKLPETFVDTYFMYQNISNRDKEDEEVDRLINLQSLSRSGAKDGQGKGRSKNKLQDQSSSKVASDENDIDSRAVSPANSDHYDELTPSEDEGGKLDDQTISPAKKENATENTLAKSSLMDDNDSDEESLVKIKKEKPDSDTREAPKKTRPGPKSKCKPAEPVDTESMMLTADKMMNRELNLLHAPIVLDDEQQKTPAKGPVTRNRQKTTTKSSSDSKRIKVEDGGSSSEEEKHQWFTIKEKLLKKMINKKDTTREDDAKRAKLVNEFIERRGDLAENYLKRRKGQRSKRSIKKMLERQKQFKVLSRELFGDVSNDASHQGKGRNSSYFKGRRNIRKVIDKKSLAKSTVLANMEEFERKRRLNQRQNKLREIMGCEEGVNVLVINDEVCLEYDFESRQPVVTIHPFFTKVMKAHQYEGVKFMWDACFESLENIEAGHPGGGCILAHCMGLGKTLQVLALLHTVLTHPRVGMQRVLVCCPLSTVLNWVDEIHKWIGPVTDQIKVFELSKLKKTYERAYQLEDWYKGGGIFIIGYELFRSLTTLDPYLDDVRPVIVNKIRGALLDPGPDIIICDEGHLLKNDCSVLAVAMSRVRTSRRIVLTGTPMQNNLREYFCMVNFVKPNLLGTYAEYSNRFENPIMNGQHRDSREEDIKLMKARTHILHKVLEGCLQRQEASVLYPYLPKKHEYTVFVSPTKCQWDLYKHYLQNCTSTHSNKNNVLKDFHILQKIWSHPQVLHNFQSRMRDDKNKVKLEKLEDDLAREDLNAEDIKPSDTDTWWLQYLEGGEMLDSLHSSNKFVCVFRILDECIALGDKLLIFSTSLFTMDALEYFLKQTKSWSLGKEYYRLDGSVPAEVRQKWCREFNAEQNLNTKLFLISTRAGCLGLNMVAANRVIILDTSWNPAHDIQSIFRVYRFGQKKDCYIYRLVAMGTMEQKIYERSVTKQAVACRVVDEQQIDRHYNSADLTELYKYDETGVGVAGGVAVGVEDVVLLRVARDTNLHAVHEHDSLLRGSGEQGLPEHERNAAWMQFQQEHANKQMQENLTAQPSQSTVKQVHDHEYVKPATAKSTDKKPKEIKTEKEDTAAFEAKPERKRGPKKNSVVSCYIPIEPQASNASVPAEEDREEELVTKITHILIKHNFHIRQQPQEIAALVANVRKIVSSGRLDDLRKTDELSASIASLLIQNDLPMRQLTDIVCESVNNTLGEPAASSSKEEPKPRSKGRKKGKRKTFVYEEIKPLEKPQEVEIEYDGRRRRRAALEAEKSFDTITDAVADASADESDGEFVPEPNVRIQIENQRVENQRVENNRSQNITVKEEPVDDTLPKRKTYIGAKSKRDDVKTQPSNEDSIVLSDDDEEPPPKKKPGPARKTMKVRLPEVKAPEPVKTQNETEEVIPLHPSLLSNQNFIKIVAHTYLTGNPMLDEDAATLAAQYSTQKALKEFETTGKQLESGPLYDIAVRVLGIDILKKLQHTKGNAPAKPAQPEVEKPQEKVEEILPEPAEPAKPAPKLKGIKLKIRMPVEGSLNTPVVTSSSSSNVVPSSSLKPIVLPASSLAPKVVQPSVTPSKLAPIVTPSSLTPNPNVVPVGFYRLDVSRPHPTEPWTHVNINSCLERNQYYTYRPQFQSYRPEFHSFIGAAEMPAENNQQSADECILPDDDDIRIISDPTPPLQQLDYDRQPTPINIVPVSRPTKNAPRQQLIVNNVKSGNSMRLSTGEENGSITIEPPPTVQTSIVQTQTRSASKTLTTRSDLFANPTTNAAPTVTKPAADYNTICLDSDDEDILPTVNVSNRSSAPTQPVPVSLTTANSHIRLSHEPSILPNETVTSGQQPIILNSFLKSKSNIIPDLTSQQTTPAKNAQNSKFIVLPSSKFKLTKRADLPPGVVPIAMSGVNVTQPIRAPANEAAPQIIEDDVESILPVSNPEPSSGIKRTTCKPGDILRISKSGHIEVLNRKDQTAVTEKQKVATTPTKLVVPEKPKIVTTTHKSMLAEKHQIATTPMKISNISKPSTSETVTIDLDDFPAVSTVSSVNVRNKKSNDSEGGRKESDSTSSSTRPKSNSPFDPLSILRDVVHIEADDYSTQQAAEKSLRTPSIVLKDKQPPQQSKPTKSNNSVLTSTKEKTTLTSLHKQTRSNASSIQTQSKSMKSNTQSIIDNFKSSDIKVSVTTGKKPTVQNTATKTVVITRKTNERVPAKSDNSKKGNSSDMTIIDITSSDQPTTSTDRHKGKSKTITGSTIIGTSKDIILCGAGKAIKRSQPPPVAQQHIEKKRASTATEPASVKKKKTDKPMTLKDFDIDDIDDIIELD